LYVATTFVDYGLCHSPSAFIVPLIPSMIVHPWTIPDNFFFRFVDIHKEFF